MFGDIQYNCSRNFQGILREVFHENIFNIYDIKHLLTFVGKR